MLRRATPLAVAGLCIFASVASSGPNDPNNPGDPIPQTWQICNPYNEPKNVYVLTLYADGFAVSSSWPAKWQSKKDTPGVGMTTLVWHFDPPLGPHDCAFIGFSYYFSHTATPGDPSWDCVDDPKCAPPRNADHFDRIGDLHNLTIVHPDPPESTTADYWVGNIKVDYYDFRPPFSILADTLPTPYLRRDVVLAGVEALSNGDTIVHTAPAAPPAGAKFAVWRYAIDKSATLLSDERILKAVASGSNAPPTGWGALGLGTNAAVLAVATDCEGHLYAAGDFTTAGGVTVNYIASWNGTTWSAVGGGMNAPVRALLIDDNGDLLAGGDFTMAGTTPANRVARWNGTTWSALGTGISGGSVGTMAEASDGKLYVGGNISGFVWQWNGSSWSSVPGANGLVYAVATQGTTLYAGGLLNPAGSNGIASWNGSTWSPVGTGMNSAVNALTFGPEGFLYAGGAFTTAGGNSAEHIARWNGSTWSALGAGTNGTVHDIEFDDQARLYAAGEFTSAGGQSASRIATWDGSVWSPLGSGVNDYILDIVTIAGSVYGGGVLQSAGGLPASNIASWNASYLDTDGDGYGDPTRPSLDCSADGLVSNNTDCDDSNPRRHPDALDWCNGLDDDCDGDIDEGHHAQSPWQVAWWKGEQNTVDTSEGHDGTALNGLSYAAGRWGQAFRFDGIGSYVDVPADPAFDISGSITIEGWINTTHGVNKYIVTKDEDSFYLALGPTATSPNKLSFWLNGVTNTWVQGTTNLNDGQWHHVAGTYDGAFMKVYVDGALQNSVAKTGNVSTGPSSVMIGRRPSEGVFDGLIDELTISSRALSAEEIAAIHANGRCGNTGVSDCAAILPNPIAWWRLDGSGSEYFGNFPASKVGPGGAYTSGEIGPGFHPEVGTILQVADAPALTPGHLTVDAWVYLDYLPTGAPLIVWKGDGAGTAVSSSYVLGIYGYGYGGAGRALGAVANSSGYSEATSTIPAPIGAWCHLALTADGSTVKLYQDGQLVGSASQDYNIGATAYPLQIGGTTALSAAFSFPGTIDEVEIHGSAASAERIRQIYEAGPFGKCPVQTADTPVGDAELSFLRVTSNPSIEGTGFWFSLPAAGPVRLEVFDAAGRRVQTLLNGTRNAGMQRVRWDGRSSSGTPVSPGVYFAKLHAAGRVHSARFVWLR